MTTTRTDGRFLIPRAALLSLGTFVGDIGGLSLLGSEPMSDDVRSQLIAAGVLGNDGYPAPAFRGVLDLLAHPVAIVQVNLTGGNDLSEFTVVASHDDTVSMLATAEGLELASPAETDDAMSFLTHQLGFSMIAGLNTAVHLDPASAMVFAAHVDAGRRAHLGAMLDGGTTNADDIDPSAVRAALHSRDPRWLVPIVRAFTGEVAADIDTMTDQLRHAAAQMAARFLVFDQVATVTSAGLSSGGERLLSQVVVVQAGLHDLLVIEGSEDGVGMIALPAALVTARIGGLLADPVGAVEHDEDGSAQPAAPFCTSCGTQFQPDGQFCATCGARRP